MSPRAWLWVDPVMHPNSGNLGLRLLRDLCWKSRDFSFRRHGFRRVTAYSELSTERVITSGLATICPQCGGTGARNPKCKAGVFISEV